MSYSSNRRDALDPAMPIAHRASHVRSCAVVVAQKLRIGRDAVFARLEGRAIDVHALRSEADFKAATALSDLWIDELEVLRFSRGKHGSP